MKRYFFKSYQYSLIRVLQDVSVQQFLLTNLIVPPASSPDKVKFQVPLSILKDSIPALGSFPYEPGERSWSGRTLVIRGSKSKQVPSLPN
jgi:hypothetical protein